MKKQFAFFNVSLFVLVILDLCRWYVGSVLEVGVPYTYLMRAMYNMLNLLPVIYVLIGQAKTIKSEKAS